MTSDTAKNTMNKIIIINKAIIMMHSIIGKKRGSLRKEQTETRAKKRPRNCSIRANLNWSQRSHPNSPNQQKLSNLEPEAWKAEYQIKNQKLITQDQYFYPLQFKILRKQSETKQC